MNNRNINRLSSLGRSVSFKTLNIAAIPKDEITVDNNPLLIRSLSNRELKSNVITSARKRRYSTLIVATAFPIFTDEFDEDHVFEEPVVGGRIWTKYHYKIINTEEHDNLNCTTCNPGIGVKSLDPELERLRNELVQNAYSSIKEYKDAVTKYNANRVDRINEYYLNVILKCSGVNVKEQTLDALVDGKKIWESHGNCDSITEITKNEFVEILNQKCISISSRMLNNLVVINTQDKRGRDVKKIINIIIISRSEGIDAKYRYKCINSKKYANVYFMFKN